VYNNNTDPGMADPRNGGPLPYRNVHSTSAVPCQAYPLPGPRKTPIHAHNVHELAPLLRCTARCEWTRLRQAGARTQPRHAYSDLRPSNCSL